MCLRHTLSPNILLSWGMSLLSLNKFICYAYHYMPLNLSRSDTIILTIQYSICTVGAQAPLGFWDPLGLLNDADQDRFDRLRYVETKHGRIAMLALVGHMVTTAGYRLPGDIAYNVPFASVKNGLAAFDDIPVQGIAQIVAFIGLIELGQ